MPKNFKQLLRCIYKYIYYLFRIKTNRGISFRYEKEQQKIKVNNTYKCELARKDPSAKQRVVNKSMAYIPGGLLYKEIWT